MVGEAGVRRAYRRVWAWSVGAHLAVVSSFFVGSMAWNLALFPDVPLLRTFAVISSFGSGMFVIASWYLFVRVRTIVGGATTWYAEGRPATDDEQHRLALVPRRIAAIGAQVWVAVLPFGIFVVVRFLEFPLRPSFVVKALIGWVSLGFAATMLSYLLVERALRTERAEALGGRSLPPGPGAMGMRTRLLLAWLGAAALPLLTIAIFFIDATPDQRARSAAVVWMTGGVGLIAGFIVTLFASRTIIEPILRVRSGMNAVAEGNLDTHIDVDDASELGLLQSGFNQMVDGLKERERMRDIFGRHVGTEVARQALENDFGLGGERCEATTMFVDMIGSTGMALRHEPDEVVASLNAFFAAVVAEVALEGGFVNQFQGDGAVCVFGVPERQGDHAERALRAGRKLRDELRRLGVAAAIGISSGEIVAGNVGTADRYGFTVIGDPVNEAARLTDEAKLRPCRVLASSTAVGRAGDEAANWAELGPIGLRGRDRATLAYEPA